MRSHCNRSIIIAMALTLTIAQATRAGWLDWLNKPATSNQPPAGVTALTQEEIAKGLKEALGNGVQHAIHQLGGVDGFMTNLNVRIPMPPQLATVEKTLRAVKQDKMADDFVLTMNRAAETAVSEAAPVFVDALGKMTLQDAQEILKGQPDAATQYFRKTSEETLRTKFRPIVEQATAKTGVTSAYKNLLVKAGPAAQLLGGDARDIDGYVTQKALDGLFTMIAEEEKRIRENPIARTTDLLKRVFGGSGK